MVFKIRKKDIFSYKNNVRHIVFWHGYYVLVELQVILSSNSDDEWDKVRVTLSTVGKAGGKNKLTYTVSLMYATHLYLSENILDLVLAGQFIDHRSDSDLKTILVRMCAREIK